MTLVRYHRPLDLFTQFQNDINKLFENRFGEGEDSSKIATTQWSPSVDIKEEDNRFVIYADLPGVEVKDIEITMENGVLSIKGERSYEDEVKEENFHRIERAHGTFYRRFSLPDSADEDNINASGKNGVLEITIPKKEKEQPRRIPVKD
jgi:HSP20 family protein